MPTILITGAAGGVGRVSCDGLRSRGWRVVGLDHSADPGCCDRFHRCEITDREALRAASADCDAVLHLAAVPATNADFLTQLVEPNLIGTWRVLEAAVEAGVERVILASSIQAACGPGGETPEHVPAERIDPGNPYGLSKAFAEDAARLFHQRHGLRTLCARIATFGHRPSSGNRLAELAARSEFGEADHYLSHDDWLRWLECALAADYDCAVAYAVSRPRGERWPYDPASARATLGYEPRDRWPEGLPGWVFAQPAGERRQPRATTFTTPPGEWRGDPRRVLVTGAAGVIGRHLGPALRARGWCPVGFDRAEDPGGFEAFHRGELTDATTLAQAIEGCGALVHLAANPDSRAAFDDLVEPNLRGLWTALEVAHRAGTPRVVLASSINACNGPRARAAAPAGTDLDDPGNPYGVTKIFAERAGRLFHRHHGTPVVALRIGWFPRNEREVRRAVELGGGGCYLSWDDCVGWIAAALEHPDPGFALAYALSDNGERAHYDLASSIAALDYTPRDRFPAGLPPALRALAEELLAPARG